MAFLWVFFNVNILCIVTDLRVQELDDSHMLLTRGKVYTINILLSFIANKLILVPQKFWISTRYRSLFVNQDGVLQVK